MEDDSCVIQKYLGFEITDAKSIEVKNIHICAKKYYLSEKDGTNRLRITATKVIKQKQERIDEILIFPDGYYNMRQIQDGITTFLRTKGVKSVWFNIFISVNDGKIYIVKKGQTERFDAYIVNHMHYKFLKLLGFEPDGGFLPDEAISEKTVPYLTNHFFYVYCDIIDKNHNYKEGEKSDLLTALHNKLMFADKMSISFNDLGKKSIIPNFNSIKFCIRDENDELIDFQNFTFVIEFTIHI